MDALVTDGDLVGAVAGLRGLAAAGIRTHVLAPAGGAAGLLSRHAATRHVGPGSPLDPAGFVAAVTRVATAHGPLVVYPAREESLDALFAGDLPPEVVMPYAGAGAVGVLRDKGSLPGLAAKAGLVVPATHLEGPAGTVAAADVPLPVVVKPGARGPGIPEVTVARTSDELRRLLATYPPEARVVLQEHVDGPLACLALVVDREGVVRERFEQLAGRIFPPQAGACTTARSVPPDEALSESAAAMLAAAGYLGLAQLDFILTDRGPRLIDVNPRFYISLSLATAAGVNLPGAWHAVATGRESGRGPAGYRTGLSYRRLESDFAAAVRGRPGLLLARPPRPVVGAVWSARDPLPGLVVAARRVLSFGAKHAHRHHDPGLPVAIADLDREALGARWRALAERAPSDAYLSWEWIEAWLDAYAPASPAQIVIGPPDDPVALGVVDRLPRGRWEFAGAPVSPTRALLVAEADRATAWRALAAELHRRRGSWSVLGVEGAPAEAAVLPGAELEPNASWAFALPATFDDYLAERPSTQRKGLKQKLSRMRKAGAEVVEVPAAEHPAALRSFLTFHAQRAATKGERHPQMNDDLLALLGRLSDSRDTRLRVFALRVDGALAGVTIRVDHRDGGWFYNAGFDPAHHRIGPGVLLELHSIRDAIDRGLRRFDLGPGFWRYKTDLGGLEAPAFGGEAYCPSVRGQALRALRRGRRRLYAAIPGRDVLRGARRRRALRDGRSPSDPSTAG